MILPRRVASGRRDMAAPNTCVGNKLPNRLRSITSRRPLLRQIEDALALGDGRRRHVTTGRVHQNFYLAKLLFHDPAGIDQRRPIKHVRGHGHGLAAGIADSGRDKLGARPAASKDSNTCSGMR